jgi:hypothetical protein
MALLASPGCEIFLTRKGRAIADLISLGLLSGKPTSYLWAFKKQNNCRYHITSLKLDFSLEGGKARK